MPEVKMGKQQPFTVRLENFGALADILPELKGLKAELTLKVQLERLAELPPEKVKAFCDGMAALAAIYPSASVESTAQGTPHD